MELLTDGLRCSRQIIYQRCLIKGWVYKITLILRINSPKAFLFDIYTIRTRTPMTSNLWITPHNSRITLWYPVWCHLQPPAIYISIIFTNNLVYIHIDVCTYLCTRHQLWWSGVSWNYSNLFVVKSERADERQEANEIWSVSKLDAAFVCYKTID